jgi:hypothetical protein
MQKQLDMLKSLISEVRSERDYYQSFLDSHYNESSGEHWQSVLLEIEMKCHLLTKILRELEVSAGRNYMLANLVVKTSDRPKEFLENINRQIEEGVESNAFAFFNLPEELGFDRPIPVEPQPAAVSEDEPVEEVHEEEVVEFVSPEELLAESFPNGLDDVKPVEEDVDQSKYSPTIFEKDKAWKELPDGEKSIILEKVKELSVGNLTATELSVLDLMGNGNFVVDDILKQSESLIKAQAAIDSIVNKKIAFYSGSHHEKIFMSKLGIWLYALALKKEPVVFVNNETNQTNYVFQREAETMNF